MTDQIKKESETFEEWLSRAPLARILSAARQQFESQKDSNESCNSQLQPAAPPQTPAPQGGWIAVSERLPDEGRTVLIVSNGWAAMGWRHGGTWTDWDGDECVVTHWMPLPAPPTKGDPS